MIRILSLACFFFVMGQLLAEAEISDPVIGFSRLRSSDAVVAQQARQELRDLRDRGSDDLLGMYLPLMASPVSGMSDFKTWLMARLINTGSLAFVIGASGVVGDLNIGVEDFNAVFEAAPAIDARIEQNLPAGQYYDDKFHCYSLLTLMAMRVGAGSYPIMKAKSSDPSYRLYAGQRIQIESAHPEPLRRALDEIKNGFLRTWPAMNSLLLHVYKPTTDPLLLEMRAEIKSILVNWMQFPDQIPFAPADRTEILKDSVNSLIPYSENFVEVAQDMRRVLSSRPDLEQMVSVENRPRLLVLMGRPTPTATPSPNRTPKLRRVLKNFTDPSLDAQVDMAEIDALVQTLAGGKDSDLLRPIYTDLTNPTDPVGRHRAYLILTKLMDDLTRRNTRDSLYYRGRVYAVMSTPYWIEGRQMILAELARPTDCSTVRSVIGGVPYMELTEGEYEWLLERSRVLNEELEQICPSPTFQPSMPPEARRPQKLTWGEVEDPLFLDRLLDHFGQGAARLGVQIPARDYAPWIKGADLHFPLVNRFNGSPFGPSMTADLAQLLGVAKRVRARADRAPDLRALMLQEIDRLTPTDNELLGPIRNFVQTVPDDLLIGLVDFFANSQLPDLLPIADESRNGLLDFSRELTQARLDKAHNEAQAKFAESFARDQSARPRLDYGQKLRDALEKDGRASAQ